MGITIAVAEDWSDELALWQQVNKNISDGDSRRSEATGAEDIVKTSALQDLN